MYPIETELVIGKPHVFLSKQLLMKVVLWHRCLAYLNFKYINILATGKLVRGMLLLKFYSNTSCTDCECANINKKLKPQIIDSTIKESLQLLHIDLCCPSVIEIMYQKKYILVIMDDHT